MKLTAIFILALVLHANAGIKAQNITLDLKDASLKKVFVEIRRQGGLNFVYNNNLLRQARHVDIRVANVPVEEVLKICFKDLPVSFRIIDNTVVIVKSEERKRPPISPPSPPVTVIGRVTDEDGKPVADVSILLKGTDIGTTSDANGVYSIKIPDQPEKVLVFSSIGFESQEINIGKQSVINITLRKKIKAEESAVVVAFGKQKKISVVGSIDKVNPADLKVPTRTISTSLAGRLAGVIAVQGTGEPGYDGAEFWIRGINTFTGNQRPLILVDGVERSIDMIDPDEIADFAILKDATATAVYGVRGANGVVIITTKRGTAGKPQINFSIETSFSKNSKLAKMVDGPTYMEMMNEAETNKPGGLPIFSQGVIDSTRSGVADPYYYPNVDWTNAMLKPWANSQHATMNISGGNDKTRYFVSAAFLNQNGMFKGARENSYNNNINLKRYNFRSNVDVNVTSSTVLGLTLAGSLENRNYPGNGTQAIFDAMRRAAPTWFPVAYPDKTKIPGRKGVNNPWQMLAHSGYTTEYYSRLQSNFIVNQHLNFITNGLSARFNFSFDTYTSSVLRRSMNPRKYLIVPQDLDGDGEPDRDAKGNYILMDAEGNYRYEDQDPGNSGYTSYLTREGEKGNNRNMYTELSLNYNRTFSKHTVGGLLLFNRNDYLDPSDESLFGSIPQRRQGLTGRATYGFSDRYFVEFNFGYNGSENYAEGSRMGFFPSYAIGWVLSKEKFFRPLLGAVDFLKIRLSSGKVGNDAINNRFAYLTRVENTTTNYGFGSNNGYGYGSGAGINITYYGNPNATWEIAKKSDLGLEVNFLKHFRLNADLFYEKRTNIWVPLNNVPDIYGFSSIPSANAGAMENKGVDGFLEYQQQFAKNLNITFKGTFYYGRNKILATGDITPKYAYQSNIGQPFGRTLGYVAQGLFTDSTEILKSPDQNILGATRPGDIKYKDINGDGKIDQFDRVFIGNPTIPELTFGFGASIVYKNFDLSFLLQGAARVSFIANPKPFAEVDKSSGVLTIMEDRWTKENQNIHATFPRLGVGSQDNNYVASTHWLENGSYARLKQLEIGYSLSNRFFNNSKWMKSFRVYCSGLNLFTISSFKWWDPESKNSTGMYYPVQKVLNVGLDIKF
ncbi:TonB-dependent receptor [Flavihumibacter solisilvae]|uniref:TonB-dependent receptor n=1 Tax=Flavihumibacter solisilvae TaxID=1349421 RepID=UPI00068F00C7|nr:TonB-dependent receptor [Flavihumibacter solisilvae]